jgi:SAM-dependent methyltransferase
MILFHRKMIRVLQYWRHLKKERADTKTLNMKIPNNALRSTSFDTHNSGGLNKLVWTMRIAAIRNALPKHSHSVIDLGCGYQAPLLQRLLSGGYTEQAIGVDVAPDISLKVRGLSFVHGDLNQNLTLVDNSSDVVLSLAVIEHLLDPATHVREAFRILKPGGVFILTTPTPLAKPVLECMAFFHLVDRDEVADHKHYFTASELKTVFEKAGFSPADTHPKSFQCGLNTLVTARKT